MSSPNSSMKSFTKAEIDGTRDYFRGQDFEEVQVSLDGCEFSYFVLPQSLEPRLADFAFRSTGEKADGYVLGISDSVDPRFRPFAMAHEYLEFVEIGIDTPGRCVMALERELSLVPDDIMEEYLPFRRDFFSNLIEYCSAQPDKYSPSDINEFKGSLARLEELIS